MMDNPRQREVLARPTETISADVAARMKAWYILVRQMLPGPGAGIVVALHDGQIGQIFISANLTDEDKPALANAVAQALPIPTAPPVTSAFLPVRLNRLRLLHMSFSFVSYLPNKYSSPVGAHPTFQ